MFSVAACVLPFATPVTLFVLRKCIGVMAIVSHLINQANSLRHAPG